MRAPLPALCRLRDDARAVAAIEFGLMLPLLLTIALAGFQLVAYIDSVRKTGRVATSIAQMVAQATPPAGGTTATVTSADLRFAADAAMVLFPYLLQDASRRGVTWQSDISINQASVQFTQTATTCTDQTNLSPCYKAMVAWTTGDGNRRACGTPLQPVANDAPPAAANLPASTFGPGSMIVVDVAFNYQPIVGSRFLPQIRIARTVYMQPRYAVQIALDKTTNDGSVLACPGY